MEKRLFSVREIALVALFAAIISVSSFLAIPYIVPFTLQTFAIMLTAGLLNAKCAFGATLLYILLGGVGLPVFASFQGGAGVLLSPRGGFILGFLPMVLICSLCVRHAKKLLTIFLSMLLGLCACYVFGCVYFAVMQNASIWSAFISVVLPFIAVDVIKAFLAALISFKLRKKLCLK